ncbi:MAG: YqaE/Pmp3 family membrane protein [Phycisphaerales bacterium]|nr:YqaE/Pmp3 family membrane protein [Phycisphaerales bacterium]
MADTGVPTIVLVILAFFLPPLAVGLKVGVTGQFWINLILSLLFWLPGFIHALVVVLK